MEKFNPSKALEELGNISKVPEGSGFTKEYEAMNNTVAFIQKIYDDAFAEGFKAGIDASEKIDNYDSN